MKEKPREINVESLTTPKGDVPTVKGLETAIDSVLSDFGRMERSISEMKTELGGISGEIKEFSNLIKNLSKSFQELLILLNKNENRFDIQQTTNSNQRLAEKIDLLTLKKDLSEILDQIQNSLKE
ncbi:MAG: hypothetical protein ACW97P_05320 [Candidatus Hodarchaeales archaeon]|jgi:methyl-accepting chemotaxis protein